MADTTWTQDAGMSSATEADNVQTLADQADASATVAATSASNAATSETNAATSAAAAAASEAGVAADAAAAATSEGNAATSETAAASSATSAASSAASAATSASAAATSQTAAAASATSAATSASNASTSASSAATSASNASTSEANAATSAASAAADAAAAAASATAAAASQSAAATSATAADGYATAASGYADSSLTSMNAAIAAQTAAETAETNAAASEAAAATSETNAAASETAAAGSATAAAGSAYLAGSEAASASNSATAAATSATAAASSAASALSSENSAEASAGSAGTSATAAATSAANALTSETNAADSASTATLQAGLAAGSATAAATSASNADFNATAASNSADAASISANEAAASATAAAESESSVAADAASAATSASNAATSETNAATSASTATTQATNAATSASQASTSAANAETSEVNAAGSATAAASSATSAAASATTATNQAGNASASATEAANSASAAAISETNAATSATNAAASESSAATEATAAALSESNAATSESNAATSEANAATSAATATTQASNAATSASQAATSATNASTSASSASTSATNAASSATSAATSAANAATSETNAGASASSASTSATNAATSETNAASSATSAANSASAASTSATNAATSATSASGSASTATTQATNAANSASSASSSATAAANSAATASTAADTALAALDSFDDRYLGQKASDPTADNDGNPLIAGALYFNNTDDVMKVYEGSVWVAAYASVSGALLQANNLSDLLDPSAARTNLGLGTAATTASTEYATAAQGILADSALQSSDIGVSIQGYNANTVVDATYVHTDNNYTTVEKNKLAGIEANAKDDQTITAGSGLTGGGTGDVTISHADTSAQTSVDNTGATFIQDVTLDTYGHVTGLGSAAITPATIGAAASSHTHTSTQITDLTEAVQDIIGADVVGGTGISVSYNDTTGDTTVTNTAPDQTVVLTGGTNVSVSGTYPSFTISATDTNTTYSAGSGLSLVGTTFSHSDTSAQGSVNNSGATVIQDVTLDTYGHVTGLASATLTLATLGYTGETNATADQTASEILTAIKTVDGAGSGLDADLLDGQSSAYYQPAATAITTSNIGSQSVSYAASAGNADTVDGNHATAFATAAQGALADSAVQPTDTQTQATWEAGTSTTESLVSPAKVAAAIAALGGGGGPSFDAVAFGAISTGDFVVINTDGTVSVAAGSDASVGSPTTFESATTAFVASTYDSVNNKIVVAYRDSANSNYGTAVVGTVSGTSISFGTPVVFEAAGSNEPSICFDANSGKVVIAYVDLGNSSRGTAIVGTVSGTSISFGTAVVFETGATTAPSICFDSINNKVVISYTDQSNSYYSTAVVGTVSGTSISFGTPVVFSSRLNYLYKSSCCFDTANGVVVVSFRNGASPNYFGQAIVGTVSGTSISFGSAATFRHNAGSISSAYDASSGNVIVLCQAISNSNLVEVYALNVLGLTTSVVDSHIFADATSYGENTSVSYSPVSNGTILSYNVGGGVGKSVECVVSDGLISITQETSLASLPTAYLSSAYDEASGNTVVSFIDTASGNFGKSIVREPSLTNIENYIGVSTGNYSDTSTATISVIGAVSDAQTGLSAGSKYYLEKDGSLVSTPSSESVYAGTAVSSTKLIVKG